MDETFEDWLKDEAQQPCLRKWADQLIGLGTSWDSFRRSEDAIVRDLVEAGSIPLLAARDIVKIAQDEMKRANIPMAIFWDLENMPIPESTSGRDVSSRLKSILSPYGDLVQFNGYASIGLNLIPQQKRSDLQLSGCHLVDCPHNGRKEVADKMIIVDAMKFAFMNPDGATLCFITGDLDYAYMLAALQRPSWRTIVISKGTMSSMLHVNCNMRMRWETDILQLRNTVNAVDGLPREVETRANVQVSDSLKPLESHGDDENTTHSSIESKKGDEKAHIKPPSPWHDTSKLNSLVPPTPLMETKNTTSTVETLASNVFKPLTPNEEWKDDVELLRTLLRTHGIGPMYATRKSLVGNLLRATNPARFSDRDYVRNFLASSIAARLVVESGEGAFKELCLPFSLNTSNSLASASYPNLSISQKIPKGLESSIPAKVREVVRSKPLILFAPKHRFPPGTQISKQVFVQPMSDWLLLMFKSLQDAQRIVSEELPQLCGCNLVDSRQTSLHLTNQAPPANQVPKPTLDIDVSATCYRCKRGLQEPDIINVVMKTTATELLAEEENVEERLACCAECYIWDGEKEKEEAADKVVTLLTMLAEHDDVYAPRNIIKKQLFLKHSGICTTRKHADIWIEEAIRVGRVSQYKAQNKTKQLCLAQSLPYCLRGFPPDDVDTSKEEEHVQNMLWESHTWVSRKVVNQSLQRTFPRMQTPFIRTKVFLNGHQKGKFYLAKGPLGQTVGLTPEDAEASLELMNKSIESSGDQASSSETNGSPEGAEASQAGKNESAN